MESVGEAANRRGCRGGEVYSAVKAVVASLPTMDSSNCDSELHFKVGNSSMNPKAVFTVTVQAATRTTPLHPHGIGIMGTGASRCSCRSVTLRALWDVGRDSREPLRSGRPDGADRAGRA